MTSSLAALRVFGGVPAAQDVRAAAAGSRPPAERAGAARRCLGAGVCGGGSGGVGLRLGRPAARSTHDRSRRPVGLALASVSAPTAAARAAALQRLRAARAALRLGLGVGRAAAGAVSRSGRQARRAPVQRRRGDDQQAEAGEQQQHGHGEQAVSAVLERVAEQEADERRPCRRVGCVGRVHDVHDAEHAERERGPADDAAGRGRRCSVGVAAAPARRRASSSSGSSSAPHAEQRRVTQRRRPASPAARRATRRRRRRRARSGEQQQAEAVAAVGGVEVAGAVAERADRAAERVGEQRAARRRAAAPSARRSGADAGPARGAPGRACGRAAACAAAGRLRACARGPAWPGGRVGRRVAAEPRSPLRGRGSSRTYGWPCADATAPYHPSHPSHAGTRRASTRRPLRAVPGADVRDHGGGAPIGHAADRPSRRRGSPLAGRSAGPAGQRRRTARSGRRRAAQTSTTTGMIIGRRR